MKHFNKVLMVTLLLEMYLAMEQYPKETSIYRQGFFQVVIVMALFCFSILAGGYISEKIKIYQESYPNQRTEHYSYIERLIRKILPQRFRWPYLPLKPRQYDPDVKVSPPKKTQYTQENPLGPRHRGILEEANRGVNPKLQRLPELLLGISIGVGASILVLLIQSYPGHENFISATKLIPLYLGITGASGLIALLIYLRRKGK